MTISALAAVVLTATAIPPGGVLPGEQAAYESMLAERVRAADATFGASPCPDSKIAVVTVIPWKITDHPDLVVWREKVRVTGCGRTSIENVNAGRIGGSPPWKITAGLPGDSLADMDLQSSTLPAATAQARSGLDVDCKTQLADVYIVARPGGAEVSFPGQAPPPHRAGRPQIMLPDELGAIAGELDMSQAWMEVWPFKVCDQDRTLGVVFIPKKDRTASLHLFLPVWQQIAAHGPGARPAAAPPGD
jgi:hypothetical protein